MMEKANTLAQAWPCARCRLTVFSTGEEQQVAKSRSIYGSTLHRRLAAVLDRPAPLEMRAIEVDLGPDWPLT
jgi:hypothetical protein